MSPPSKKTLHVKGKYGFTINGFLLWMWKALIRPMVLSHVISQPSAEAALTKKVKILPEPSLWKSQIKTSLLGLLYQIFQLV